MRYVNFSYLNNNLPSSLNFGPNETDHLSVEQVANLACKYWNSSDSRIVHVLTNFPQENKQIFLNSDLAKRSLDWHPKLDANQAIRLTLDWWKKYEHLKNKNEVYELYDNDMNLFFR